MLTGFLIGVISSGIWIHKCTGTPTVTLTASSSPYFDIGGSITLTCSIDEDINPLYALLTKGGANQVRIVPKSSSGCEFKPSIINDSHIYSGTCEQNIKTVHITINITDASDHNVTWGCGMVCQQPCGCPSGSCATMSNVKTALRVPVSSVQLKSRTDQPLVTPVPVMEGSNRDFRCDTSPNGSRPQALFKWYKRSENQSPILIQDQSISTPGPGPEFDLSVNTSYSTLTLMGSRSYHNMYIYCEAQDETNRGNVTRSREVQLNIVYPPIVQLFPNTSSWNVTEESPKFEFRCNVTDANPMSQPDGYSWLFGGHVLQGQTRSSLVLLNVQKSQDGVYQCMARNEYGIGNSSTMRLNVHYGAEITNLSVAEGNTVNENNTATLRCLVDSNPKSNITWTKQGILGNLQTNYFVHESQLIIDHAQCLDTANYTCNANNGLGSSVKKNVPLYVTCHPRTDFQSPLVTKVYSMRYGNASLNYTVIAFPEPIFNWSFIGNGSESKHLPDSANKQDIGLQSILIFTNLSINDFGFYRVIANNSSPTSATEVFQLIPADVPDLPSNVTVTDIRQTSLTVNWVARFNGGLQQTFQINITANDITRSVYAPDPGYGKSGTQTIENLMANTEYSISMTANNSMGSSSVTNVIKVFTLKEPDTDNPNNFTLAAALGGIGAGVGVILMVALVVFLVRRYRHLTDEQMYENAAHVDGSSKNVYEGLSSTSGDNAYDTLGASNGTCVEKDSLMYVNLKLKPLTNKNGEPNIGRQKHQTEAARTVDGLMGESL